MPRIRLPWQWDDQDAGAFAIRVYASRFPDQKGWKVAEVSADERAAEFDLDEGEWTFSILRVWMSGAEDDWQAPGAPRLAFSTDTLVGQTAKGTATAEPSHAAAALVDSSLEARVTFDAVDADDPPAKVQVVEGTAASTGKVLAEVEAMPAGPTGPDYGRQVSAAFPAEGRPDADKSLTLRAISRAGVPSAAPVTVTVRTPPTDQFYEVALVTINGTTHTGMPTPAATDKWEYDATDGLRLKTFPANGSDLNSDWGDGTTGILSETEFGAMLVNSATVESDELDVGAVCTFRLQIVDTIKRKTAAGLIGAMQEPPWWLMPDPTSDPDLRVARNSPLWLAREVYTDGSPRQPLRQCRWEYVISDSSSVAHADSDYKAYVPGMIVRGRYLRVRVVLYDPTGAHQIICPTASVTAQLIRTPVVVGSGSPEGVVTRPPGMHYVDSGTGIPFEKASGLGATGWIMGRPVVYADLASTANENTASASATIDGTAPSSGVSRILLKNQSTSSQNGLWIWNGAGNAYTRVPFLPAGDPIPLDICVNVLGGATLVRTLWVNGRASAGTIGTDSWTWYQVGGGSTPTGTGFRHVTSGTEDAAAFEPVPKVTSPPGLSLDPTGGGGVGTSFASNSAYAVYVGRAWKANPTLDVTVEVFTAYAAFGGTPYAKVCVAIGAFVPNGAATLTTVGTTDVSTTFDATGVVKTQVTTSGVAAGDDLWAVFGSKSASTRYQLRGCLPDVIRSGVAQSVGATDPASLSSTGMTLESTAFVPPYVSAFQS